MLSRNEVRQVSPERDGLARPTKGLIRNRFDKEKNSVIESGVGKQDTWAKKVGVGDCGVLLDDIPKLLDVLGLKAVDKNKMCVDQQVFDSYKILAIAALTRPEALEWDGDE